MNDYDMNKELDIFEKKCQQIIDDLNAENEIEKRTNLIYHYTDENGLWGILSSGTIRATNIFSLNDPNELKHGLEIAQLVFEDKAKELSNFEKEFVRKFRVFTQKKSKDLVNLYCLSFSLHYDELSQWRSYANDGKGFAIGFNKNKIENYLKSEINETNGGFLINYDNKELIEKYTYLFNLAIPLIEKVKMSKTSQIEINKLLKTISSLLAIRVLEISFHFKHEAYKSESEYRLLKLLPFNQTPNFRNSEVDPEFWTILGQQFKLCSIKGERYEQNKETGFTFGRI